MYFEELKLNEPIALSPVTVDKAEMLSFAQKYDNIPLHTDEDYAETTPFGQLLAPGVLSFLLVWAKYLEQDLFGEELLAGTSTKIEWHKPVFAGDTLYGTAQITEKTPRNARNGLAVLTITAENQRGEKVLTGTVEGIVKRIEN